jgi:hypothetical protein
LRARRLPNVQRTNSPDDEEKDGALVRIPSSVVIDRSVTEVFALVTDVANEARWRTSDCSLLRL